MTKLSTKLFVLVAAISLIFCVTASANPAIVSYGGSYSNTLTAGQGYAYILPNAKTTGTSVKITASSANTLRLHYYWSYNNTTIDLGTAIVNSTNYNGGSGYYSPGTLITVVERVPGSTTAYPSVSYTISFN
ncbi:hypothetical protein [Paenibacillus harenae]|uniref:Uncharacterized protein n=1 Tax=Paenibacillus harenae TaxID=306543 RepID=A0ABT9U5I5_PAEHA|nr:hypothetical protein [Paenibacillus harenae]MDQ0063310.1 hypothetical protein [Paenibacillus harenae]MDQ0114901.1 hypothetical protein [Paenibacillus harenae]